MSKADYKSIANKLKFAVPYARYLPKYKLGRWDGKINFFGIGGTGYVNHLDIIVNTLVDAGVEIAEIKDHRVKHDLTFKQITKNYWSHKTWPKGHIAEGEKIILRDYQVEVVNNFLKNPQALQEVATGAGKTIITATLSHLCEKYGRTLVIVPNKNLVTQTEEDYINCGLDVGVYFGDRKELGKTHTICTWQSLNILDKKQLNRPRKGAKRDGYENDVLTLAEFLEGVETLIVDEVHQAKAEVLKKLLTQNLKHAPIRWGLTGTVPKEDFEFQAILASLGQVIGKISAKELQDKGVLSNCHVNVVQLVDTQVHKNYQEELKYLVTNKERIKYIGKMINSIKDTGNTLVLIDRIASGEKLQEEIPNSVFIKGDVKLVDRKEQYDEIKEATNKILIATFFYINNFCD